MRSILIVSAFVLGFAGFAKAQIATPVTAPAPAAAAAPADEPVPRAERAKARQDCVSENIALTGEDLRAAMRICMQGKFPGVQLYARDGVTRDGRRRWRRGPPARKRSTGASCRGRNASRR